MALYLIILSLLSTITLKVECTTTEPEISFRSTTNEKDANMNAANSAIEDEGGGQPKVGHNILSSKVLAEVKIHPNGSAMSVGNKHWDDIVSTLLKQKNSANATSRNSTKPKLKTDKVEKKRFSCLKCEDYYCEDPDFCHDAVQCFKARRRDSTGTETYSRGCISNEEQVTFICSSSFHLQVEALGIKCCQENLCNDEDYPPLPKPSANLSNNSDELMYIALYVIGGTLLIVGLIVCLLYFAMTRYFFKQKSKYLKGFFPRSEFGVFSTAYRDDKLFSSNDAAMRKVMLGESMSSGSGAGLPLFVQRTLAKNIYLEECIGKGRYGEVWRGNWHGETVAVKIFSSANEEPWDRETEIYSIILVRHENILGFYGSDRTTRESCTQLWLVTHYHQYGSLYNYLQTHVLDHQELFTICLTIINGLVHLHTEIMGTQGSQGKPAIAHRDLTSNNILVKDDGTCCISDFGMAVFRVQGTGEINIGSGERMGTKRYMCPEILDGTMDMDIFESHRRADIYAVAFVMWEAAIRCLCKGIAEEYSRPFGNLLPGEPSFEDMQRLVCIQEVRPIVPNRWADDKVLSSLERVLSECWHQNPNVRLTALRIKKNLLKISSEELMDDVKEFSKIL